MACYHPQTVYRSKQGRNKETGNWPIVFNKSEGYEDLKLEIPCGRCIGCRLERSRVWAIRCVHEASLHEKNCFITLTYNNENCTKSLIKEHFQLFMKRLRKKYGEGIRFFHCGEYGTKNNRPHHHACIFNHDFEDKKLWNVKGGNKLYTSESLDKLWKMGYCIIGEVDFQSAAYVARYVTKKIYGEAAKEAYKDKKPEYITMSRKPGIGKEFYDKFKKDMFSQGFMIVDKNGKKIRLTTPRYYDKLYNIDEPEKFGKIKTERIKKAKKHKVDQERLEGMEKFKQKQFKKLKRSFEDEKKDV
jgi:hypothetical protein